MQFLINKTKADAVIQTAPTIATASTDLNGHAVRIETFDYGLPMGWAAANQDVRVRVFLNGALLPSWYALQGKILAKARPKWLPKGITIAAWNNTLYDLSNSLKGTT